MWMKVVFAPFYLAGWLLMLAFKILPWLLMFLYFFFAGLLKHSR